MPGYVIYRINTILQIQAVSKCGLMDKASSTEVKDYTLSTQSFFVLLK